jgi:rare lipoprotein A (peptidoglycan hydrolase)
MLFKKIISTTLALTSVASPVMVPMESKAALNSTYEIEDIAPNNFEIQFHQKHMNYQSSIASIRGQASWYGPGFYGNRTANGEIYRPGTMTAAHRSLPFGTRVRVTNLLNGRTEIVRINDRGPYVGGRILDLGEGAATALGVKSSGVAPIRMQVLN